MVLHPGQHRVCRRVAGHAAAAAGPDPMDGIRFRIARCNSAFSADGSDPGLSELPVLAFPGFDRADCGQRAAGDFPIGAAFYDHPVLCDYRGDSSLNNDQSLQ